MYATWTSKVVDHAPSVDDFLKFCGTIIISHMRSFIASNWDEKAIRIKIGESAKENDQLFHAAAEQDWWFHLDNHSSAHLWVGAEGSASNMDKRTARRCATILKEHHNRKGGNILVCYTQRNILRKDKTCPAGTLVIAGDVCRVKV